MATQSGPGPSDQVNCLETLSVRELKKRLADRGLDATDCLEKADLVKRLREAAPAPPTSTTSAQDPASAHRATSSAGGASIGAERRRSATAALASLPVAELRDLLKRHDATASVVGATEKSELAGALMQALSRCPICLDDAEDEEAVYRCDGCRAAFHRPCAAQHALSAAESGRLPLLCPIVGCKERWRPPFVSWALSEAELSRYNTAVRNVRELRNSTGSSQTSLSPRTAEFLRNSGARACPQCGAFIEKQAAGLTHGCDKMTCRCGCKFCYRCGQKAGPDGRARCSCVGENHSYLSHEDVLHNYGINADPFFQSGFAGIPGFPHAQQTQAAAQQVQAAAEQVQAFASAMGMGDFMQQALGAARTHQATFQQFSWR